MEEWPQPRVNLALTLQVDPTKVNDPAWREKLGEALGQLGITSYVVAPMEAYSDDLNIARHEASSDTSKELLVSPEKSTDTEKQQHRALIREDLNCYLKEFMEREKGGRPDFNKRPIDKGDPIAVDYVTTTLAYVLDRFENKDIFLIAAGFSYLSDLATDEQGGSFDGLLNDTENIRMLRSNLVRVLKSLPSPARFALETGLTEERCADIFDTLFVRTIGVKEYGEFADKQAASRLTPEQRHQVIQEYLYKYFES